METVEQNTTINGIIVTLICELEDIQVFEDGNDETKNLFFMKNGVVVKKLKIVAGCCQGFGYISELIFED